MLCLRHRRIVLAINMDPKIFASVRLVHLESRSRHIIFFGLTGDAARSPGPRRLATEARFRRLAASCGDDLCGNQPVCRDDAAVLARSSGEEPAPPRHRAGIASMAWRTTRRFSTNAP